MKFINKEEYYSIGETAEKLNLTKKTIRFYDEMGLINPYIDPNNSYRYFSKEDIERLNLILYLKKIGLTLNEIAKEDLEDTNIALNKSSEKHNIKLYDIREKIVILENYIKQIQSGESFEKILKEFLESINIEFTSMEDFEKFSNFKDKTVSISKVSELTGLTIKTIRFYSDAQVIIPVYIEKINGYRHYDYSCLYDLYLIVFFKYFNKTLKEIKELQETKEETTLYELYFGLKQTEKELISLLAVIDAEIKKNIESEQSQNKI